MKIQFLILFWVLHRFGLKILDNPGVESSEKILILSKIDKTHLE